ncbi:MAG: hypothetical protein Fues2KO_45480 [Fuerstiella sp.]
MSVQTASLNRGEQVLDELRDYLRHYLEQPGSMSMNAIGRRVGVSGVSVLKFRDGGKLYFDTAVSIAETIGFDLSKSLKTVR